MGSNSNDDVTRFPDEDAATRLPDGDAVTRLPDPDAEETIEAPIGSEAATYIAPAAPRPASDRPRAGPRPGGPLTPGQEFGPRYQVLKLLGAGGMGAVYKVWDQELGIALAMKVILPEVAANPSAALAVERRFKRELLLARKVTHKHVVRIHDIGELEGVKYLTMSYVEGSDLATALKAHGKLPVARALKIVRQVVSGLQSAHEASVIHRDLKPANIMLDAQSDEALIMDFGIARAVADHLEENASPETGESHPEIHLGETMHGSIVGTLQYMAPEQGRGEEVGPQADIYSLGLIFHDMLMGPERIATPKPMEELTTRMKAAPTPVSTVDPSLPESLSKIITRCLQPKAEERFASAAELAEALDDLDEEGHTLPIVRRLSLRQVAVLLAVVLVGLVTFWRMVGPKPPPVEPDPVSVVIADFQNSTAEADLSGTLEPMLKIALEDSSFITAYGRSEVSRSLGVRPPELFNGDAARAVAVGQGLGVVLSGAVERQANGYKLTLTASEAVTGNVIHSVEQRASNKEGVLGAVTKLAADMRKALGDDISDSSQRFAMDTLSATSLDVIHDYANAMQSLADSDFNKALAGFSRAVELDPNFGLAYAGMAIASRNLDKQQDAQTYVEQALEHLDGMTERERYRTRGLYYMVTGDHQACVKEYGDLISRYSADAAARNNLALCSTYLRDLPKALDEMRQVVKILPNRALYRENLALYAAYAGDFPVAVSEVRKMKEPGVFGLLALAFGQIGQGQIDGASDTYSTIGKIDALGSSYAASGLGDLALYQGRLTDASRIFRQGSIADSAAGDLYRSATKLTALANAELLRGRKPAAIAAANDALAKSKAVKIRFLAARVLMEAGESDQALKIAKDLSLEFQEEPRAYAKIIQGVGLLMEGKSREAVQVFSDANALLDTWIGHFDLGRAYLEAGAFPQADSEFDRCVARRGEGLSLFLDEEPTYGHFPLVYYYQGRVREGLHSSRSAESYQIYADIRGKAGEDPLLPDVRRRIGN